MSQPHHFGFFIMNQRDENLGLDIRIAPYSQLEKRIELTEEIHAGIRENLRICPIMASNDIPHPEYFGIMSAH